VNIIRLNSEVKTIDKIWFCNYLCTMYAACRVNLSQFISWGDNQNIFDGNELLCLQCHCNKSLAVFSFLFKIEAPVISLRFCKWLECGSYLLHSVSYCGILFWHSNFCLSDEIWLLLCFWQWEISKDGTRFLNYLFNWDKRFKHI